MAMGWVDLMVPLGNLLHFVVGRVALVDASRGQRVPWSKGPPQNYVVVVRLRGRDFRRSPLQV